jgi:hypothetical protein
MRPKILSVAEVNLQIAITKKVLWDLAYSAAYNVCEGDESKMESVNIKIEQVVDEISRVVNGHGELGRAALLGYVSEVTMDYFGLPESTDFKYLPGELEQVRRMN